MFLIVDFYLLIVGAISDFSGVIAKVGRNA